MEIGLGTVDSDVCDDAAWRDDVLAKLESRGNTHRLDRGIYAPASR